MWLEETIGEKINVNRTDQALKLGVNTIATACPYCLTMFEDGLKTKESDKTVRALDICELVDRAL